MGTPAWPEPLLDDSLADPLLGAPVCAEQLGLLVEQLGDSEAELRLISLGREAVTELPEPLPRESIQAPGNGSTMPKEGRAGSQNRPALQSGVPVGGVRVRIPPPASRSPCKGRVSPLCLTGDRGGIRFAGWPREWRES